MKLNLNALPKVGETFEVKFKTGSFTVEVLDARIRYGNIDALVKPVSGSGEFWTVYHKVETKSNAVIGSAEPIEVAEEVIDEDLENASLVE